MRSKFTCAAEESGAFTIPREDSWGPSTSVNQIELDAPDDAGLQRLTIEMQTGDLIEFDSMSYEWVILP